MGGLSGVISGNFVGVVCVVVCVGDNYIGW
jgi:hypothetical protein